jgi:hypothetical protein
MKIHLCPLRFLTIVALGTEFTLAFHLNPVLTRPSSSFQLLVQKTSTSIHESSSTGPDELFESAVGRGWRPPRGTFTGLRRVQPRNTSTSSVNSATQRQMSDTNGAVMPDGGVSPCIIKVIGVGGGGCNAVSQH